MNLEHLEANNAKTLNAISEGRVDAEIRPNFPFFGFYNVELFECPPFLMFTNNDCPRAFNILYDKVFEPTSMRVWCRLARHATGILDIGAHVGVFCLAAASLRTDIKIHAFEPNPYAYTRLRMHIMMNDFRNIEEHPFAVGNQSAVVKFSWVKKASLQISSGGGVGARGEGAEEIIVPMQKLDGSGLAGQIGDRGLVKIDVEGGEIQTIDGMGELLARRPDILLESFSPKACDHINAQILPLGYKVYLVNETTGALEPRDKLHAALMASGNFNQFLTVRSPDQVALLV